MIIRRHYHVKDFILELTWYKSLQVGGTLPRLATEIQFDRLVHQGFSQHVFSPLILILRLFITHFYQFLVQKIRPFVFTSEPKFWTSISTRYGVVALNSEKYRNNVMWYLIERKGFSRKMYFVPGRQHDTWGAFHYAKPTGQRSVGIPEENEGAYHLSE